MGDNVILNKSKAFAVKTLKLCKHLQTEHKEYVLTKQLLRSGTSIGANVRESSRAQSRADFFAKMYVAYKEADESAYWIELLHECDYIDDLMFKSIYDDCQEIVSILSSITKNQKEYNWDEKTVVIFDNRFLLNS